VETAWTLSDLVAHATAAIASLPAPANGQIRAVPDERTIRYYGTIGLLDRPAAMRGRTALYGRRHLAQVIAIKRLQGAGRSLAEIQALWPTLDDHSLSRMAGLDLTSTGRGTRKEFWKQSPARVALAAPVTPVAPAAPVTSAAPSDAVLRLELAPTVALDIALTGDLSLSAADLRALRAAAAPLLAELARRGLTPQNQDNR
jgi:DNA-binding transcriptional MerR regulator